MSKKITPVIDLVTKNQKAQEEYKKDLLEHADAFRKLIEDDQVKEFVITSVDEYGEVIITACTKDYITALGLYEMGKQSLIMNKFLEE